MAKRRRKLATKKIDGINPKDLKNIRNAIRLIWQRSHVRKLVVNRCIGPGGFSYCEQCRRRAPKVFIDHKTQVGDVLTPGFIERMFTPSKNLQGLCKECHAPKTKREAAASRAVKAARVKINDFY